MSKKAIILLVYVFWVGVLSAQNRYMVFLKDKAHSIYTTEKPSDFLTERAIARKQKMQIEIKEDDLPVSKAYLDSIENLGLKTYFTSRWLNAVLVQTDTSSLSKLKSLSFVKEVKYVAKNARLTATREQYEVPSEFLKPPMVAGDPSLQLNMLGIPEMHKDGFKGEGKLIAVFDAGFTGVNKFAPFQSLFEENRLVAVRDFVFDSFDPFRYSSHGTSVLSTLTAEYEKYTGTAPEARYLLCVTEDTGSETWMEEYNWWFAAELADSLGADIIHSSLGYYDFNEDFMNYSLEDLDGKTAIITQAVNKAYEKGMLVVTSAGNEGTSAWKYITAPADSPYLLTVGSVTSSYQKSNFSSVGPTADNRIKPDVMALGTQTIVMNGSGAIIGGNGTSFAAPLVAGMMAGLWQAFPDKSIVEMLELIRHSSSRASSPDSLFGYGIPSYRIAKEGVPLSLDNILQSDLNVFPNPFKEGKIYIEIESNKSSLFPLEIQLSNLQGQVIIEKQYLDKPLDNQLILEVPESPTGIYFLQIRSRQFSRKVKLLRY